MVFIKKRYETGEEMICLGDTTTLLPLLLRSASACSLADIRPYSFVTELAMDLNTRESFGDLLVPISIIFFLEFLESFCGQMEHEALFRCHFLEF